MKKQEATIGAGKTYYSVKKLAETILQEPIIFSSLTKKLSLQSYEDYMKMNPLSPAKLIDSDVFKPVAPEILRVLFSGFKGVLFITHSSYMSILKPTKDLDITVIIDEIPSETIKYVDVIFDDNTAPSIFNEWLVKNKCQHSKNNVFVVELKEEYKEVALTLAEDIRKKKNTAYSEKVAVILESLLSNTVDVMYYANATKEGEILHKYQSIESQLLHDMVVSNHAITVMGANVMGSSFAYIASNLYGVTFTETANYRKTHACKIVIYPYLSEGSWSKTLKNKTVGEGLKDREGTVTVREDIQLFAEKLLDKDFLMCKNSDDVVIPSLQDKGIECTTTQVHGMNHYKHLHKAAFIASANIPPDEKKALALFAVDNGLDNKLLTASVKTERCHETNRQFFGRMSVRTPESETDGIVRYAVVPDMGYAMYLAESYPNASIVTDYSYSVAERIISEEKLVKRADNRLEIVKSILIAKKNKEGKMPVILDRFGISKPTFDNYKKEFRTTLQELGLLK